MWSKGKAKAARGRSAEQNAANSHECEGPALQSQTGGQEEEFEGSTERLLRRAREPNQACKMIELAQALLFLAIPMPHAFYAMLWTKPNVWKKVAKKTKVPPVDLLAIVALCMKVVQFFSFVFYVLTLLGADAFTETIRLAHPATLLFGGLLFAVGQALNMGVYATLGKDGVYYGIKYGKKVPWVTGFPFSLCPHPQYIGSSLSIWGALWPIIRVFPGNLMELSAVGVSWSGMYALSSFIESH